LSNIANMMNKK